MGILLALVVGTSSCVQFRKPTGCELKFVVNLEDSKFNQVRTTAEILKKRLLDFDLSGDQIKINWEANKITVSLHDIDTHDSTYYDALRFILRSSGKLEFWETQESSEIENTLIELDGWLGIQDSVKRINSHAIPEKLADTTSLVAKLKKKGVAKMHPLLSIFQLNLNKDRNNQYITVAGPVVGYALYSDTARINSYLKAADSTGRFKRMSDFKWSKDKLKGSDAYSLYAIRYLEKNHGAGLICSGLADAQIEDEKDNSKGISLTMTSTDGQTWKEITKNNIGLCIAIVMDGVVISSPRVTGYIPNGKSSITGDFNLMWMKAFVAILRNKKIPCKVIGLTISQHGCN
jgi:hypothetical protein